MIVSARTRQIRSFISLSCASGTLERRRGSGRPREYDYEAIDAAMREWAEQRKYIFTYLSAAVAMSKKFGKHISDSVLHYILTERGWRTVKPRVQPKLTDEGRQKRLDWIEEWLPWMVSVILVRAWLLV